MSGDNVQQRGPRLFLCARQHGFAIAVAILASAAYAWVGLYRHAHLMSAGFDLGIFSQVVDSLAHFHAPATTIDLKAQHNFFGDHFSPILALLVPLWWLSPHPDTLVAAQGVLLGVSVLPVAAFARRRLSRWGAAVVTLSYATFWGLGVTAAFDFHEVAFAVPLIALAVERADAGRFRTAVPAVLALLLVKEDLGPFVATFGILCLLLWKRRAIGAVLVAAGVGGFLLVTQVLIPAMNPNGRFIYWKMLYGTFAPSPMDVPRVLVTQPGRSLGFTFSPEKQRLLIQLLSPFALLPLFSPLFLLAVPLLLERLWSGDSARFIDSYHYNATISPVLALAAADTWGRVRRRLEANTSGTGESSAATAGQLSPLLSRLLTPILAIALILGAALPAVRNMHPLRYAGSLTPTATEGACLRMLAALPKGELVGASNLLAPQLVPDQVVYMVGEAPRRPDAIVGYLPPETNTWDVAPPSGYRLVRQAGPCRVWRPVPISSR